jgi:hypothetical protein
MVSFPDRNIGGKNESTTNETQTLDPRMNQPSSTSGNDVYNDSFKEAEGG